MVFGAQHARHRESSVDLASNVNELQRVAEYRRAVKILRATGIGSIVVGIIALILGVVALEQSLINVGLILVGLFLVGTGIWNVALPSAEGIIIDGIALLVLPAWNLLVMVLNGPTFEATFKAGIIAVALIGWAVWQFRNYGRFHEALAEKPSPEDLKGMDELVRNVMRAIPELDADVITFRLRGATKEAEWRGRLAGGAALFVELPAGHEALVAPKEEVNITVTGKVLLGSTLKANIHIKDRNLSGLISPEAHARYEAWKNPPADEPTEGEAAG
jgi:hypothetical protein